MNAESQGRGGIYWAFAISCFFAFALTLVQIPDWLSPFWPDWVALLIVYWALLAPTRIGPVAGFAIGTILEVLTAKTLGVFSAGLATLAFLVNLSHLQLRVTSRWQQIFLVILFVATFKLIHLWLDGLVGDARLTVQDWYSLLGDLAIWPFLNIVLDELRRLYRIR